jgi:hypothetical protein
MYSIVSKLYNSNAQGEKKKKKKNYTTHIKFVYFGFIFEGHDSSTCS